MELYNKMLLEEAKKQSFQVGSSNKGQIVVDINVLFNILNNKESPAVKISKIVNLNRKDVITDSHTLEKIERELLKQGLIK